MKSVYLIKYVGSYTNVLCAAQSISRAKRFMDKFAKYTAWNEATAIKEIRDTEVIMENYTRICISEVSVFTSDRAFERSFGFLNF